MSNPNVDVQSRFMLDRSPFQLFERHLPENFLK